MTKRRLYLPAFLLPAALCLLLGRTERAQALSCVMGESIELILEERLVDGEPMEADPMGRSATLFGAGTALSLYLVGEEESFYQDRCSTLRFAIQEAP